MYLNRRNKISMLLIMLLVISLVLFGCSTDKPKESTAAPAANKAPAAKQNISLLTANATGSFYLIGAGMAKVINDHQEKYNITAEATVGSAENVKTLDSGLADFGMMGGDVGYTAIKGEGVYTRPQKMVGVLSLWGSNTHFVALDNNKSIKKATKDELKGKRIIVGELGSGSEVKNRAILEAWGLTYNDMKPLMLSFSESVDALKDGQADMLMLSQGIPSPNIVDLAGTHKIRLIEPGEEELKLLFDKYPYYSKTTIPANTYKGVDYPVTCIVTRVMMCAKAGLPDEVVYDITKTMMENWEEMHAVHASTKEVTKEGAADLSVPMHPGAQKYFKEIGALK